MFWKFHLDTSGIDTLLAKQDVTLKEVLDEEDILQECKTQNEKLMEFLTKDDVFKELLHLIVDPPPEDVEETAKYRYKNLACELITLDIDIILEKIVSETEHLDIIWNFIDSPAPLNPLVASFFSKVITILVWRKGQDTFEYLKTHDAVNKLIVHIEISAIMELFIKMVTLVESQEIRIEVSRWFDDEDLINKLILLLHPSEQEEKHYNASQLLSELVRIGRDSVSQYVEYEDDPLLLTLEKKETVNKLLAMIFEDSTQLNSDSSLVHGISTISSMLEMKRLVMEGTEELIAPMDVERIAQGVHSTLEVLSTKLQLFHDILIKPPHINTPMETTFGILDPPLGKVRLSIAALVSTAIATNTKVINTALAETGTVGILLDLFARYEWNNFLHSYVCQCILAILNSESISMENEMEQHNTEEIVDPLLKHLFEDCNIVSRCIMLWEANEISEKSGTARKGYMGHLTKILNEINNAKERGPNHETVTLLFNNQAADIKEQWNVITIGSLEEINKKNVCSPVATFTSAFDSDSDNDDYRPVNLSQYDGTLQQAFENYQVQPMTNEFIESFGYDEAILEQSENTKNPFDEVGNVDFSINANEESENEKLFESICDQKIQPFDESDEEEADDEEEDVWEEKQLTFSLPSQMPRKNNDTIGSDSDSSDEEKSSVINDVDESSNDGIKVVTTVPTNVDDKMEVDTEWTANFDNFTTNDHSASSDWATTAVATKAVITSTLSSTVEDFADFTDITKFEISEGNVSSPDAMETEGTTKSGPAALYEVKMEEDNPVNPTTEKSSENASSTTVVNSKEASSEPETLSVDTPAPASDVIATSASMVGGYVVIDVNSVDELKNTAKTMDNEAKDTSTISNSGKVTSISVKSVRSPSKEESKLDEISSVVPSTADTADQISVASEVNKLSPEEIKSTSSLVSDDTEKMHCEDNTTSKTSIDTKKETSIENNTSSLPEVLTNGPSHFEDQNPMT